MAYNDLIYIITPSGRTQGDTIIPISFVNGMARSGQIERGVVVDYSGYANYYSGKFAPQNLEA